MIPPIRTTRRVWSLLWTVPVIALSLSTVSSAQQLGSISFPNSGAAEAQKDFVDGVLLLHSFEFEDAREAFRRAQAIDSDFALAYWGEAMTHNHPLWRHKGVEEGLAALAQFAASPAERAAKAPTPRERAYLEAVDTLFGPGDKIEQDRAYEVAMAAMVKAWPDDQEARAFYALSILGTTQGTRDFRAYMRAAAEAEVVFAANPRHPGAAHYLIHSYDDPVHAPLGLRAASVYAEIAPAATHAQHMISHIYIALGRWAEAGAANEKSLAVSEERARRKELPNHRRSHHALHWLQYSYLQEGRVAEATRLLDIMTEDQRNAGTANADWYLAQMRAGQMVETGNWGLEFPAIDSKRFRFYRAPAEALVAGLHALHRKDLDAARKAIADLEAVQAALTPEEVEEHRVTEADRQIGLVTALELEALIAWQEERREEAISLLRRATTIEDSLPPEFGPPAIVKPSHELLGELLLAMDRPQEARTAFETALLLAPRRAPALLGLATAARESGDAAAAGRAAAELASVRQGGSMASTDAARGAGE